MKKTLFIFCLLLLMLPISNLAQRRKKPRISKPPKFEGIVEPLPKDEWLKISSTDTAEYYYNPAKIARTSNRTTKVWIKETWKVGAWREWQRTTALQRINELDNDDVFTNLDHVLILYEMDCDKSQLRMLNRIDYDNEGHALRSVTLKGDGGWEPIVPDSIGEAFSDVACK
jgi:Surface-adhesin protein E